MNKTLLFSFLFLLILSSVAVAEWGSYQADFGTTGKANPTFYTQLSEALPDENSLAYGSGFQPIIADFDNDGNRELIQPDGTTLQLFTASDGALSLDLEYNMGFALDTALWSGDINDSGTDEIIVVYNNTFHTLTYNGTDFNEEYSYSTGSTVYAGLNCAEVDGTWTCFAVGASSNLFIYNPATGVGSNQTIAGYTFSSQDGKDKMSYPIADITFNGQQDMAAIIISSSDEGFAVIDLEDYTVAFDKVIGSAGNTWVRGLIATSLDATGGDQEVCMTANNYDFSTYYNRDAYIQCYNGDGSTYGSVTFENTGSSAYQQISNPILANFDEDGNDDLCFFTSESGSNAKQRIHCYEVRFGTMTQIAYYQWYPGLTFNLPTTTGYNSVAAAGLLIDNNIDDVSGTEIYINDIVFNDYVFYYNSSASGSISYLDLNPVVSGARQVALADLDNDGSLDIIYGQSGSLTLMSSALSNEIPTINNSLSNGGYGTSLNLDYPICLNSTVSFTSQESGGTAAGNYINDFGTDSERLVSNCGQNPTNNPATDYSIDLDNGTSSLSSPSFSCYYNVTGTFPIRIYLQDTSNLDDYTQYNTNLFSLNVIDGSPGVTCNLGSGTGVASSTDTSATANAVDSSVDTALDSLFGTSPTLKLLVGLGIVLTIMMSTGKMLGAAAGFGAMAATGIVGLALVTFLGLVPQWVLILLTMTMLITIVFSKLVFSGGQGV